MTQFSLDKLNPNQRRAVEAKDGPQLIIAGPGSGKTRVLTSRITYLVGARNVFPYRIMAVTFTNKAAREMRERLQVAIGPAAGEVAMGTFHSLCARFLRRDGPLIGIDRNFAIFDSDDQLSVIKAAFKELNLDEKRVKPSTVHGIISNLKNELVTPEMFAPDTYINEIAQRVYEKYNAILRANNGLDFDDLLMETVRLLRESAPARERLQERTLHVLVDEFQDTNIAQYEMLRLISAKHRNLFCVGDPDQSIYKWRGADYRNAQRLEKDFPELAVIPLDQNYRSTQTILDAAMAVIKRNPNRRHINLFTEKGPGPRIVQRELYNAEEEAQYVIDTIAEMARLKAAEPGEVAVMYRTNAQSRALEDAFVRAGQPYRLVGATRFYGRKEIKDALAYLRIVNNPADSVSLRRVINVPARGIGDKSIATVEEYARERSLSMFEVLTRGDMTGRAAKALADFGGLWKSWVGLKDELNVARLFDQIMKTSGYREWMRDGTDEGEDRWANVSELRNVAAEAGDTPLQDFLNDVALVSETDNVEDNPNAPTLLTLHAAKGLEYKVVFITGLEDGILPHSRTFDKPEDMAEERRLFYVGITRAKERLYLLRAFRRGLYGPSDATEASRFLRDLPEALVDGKKKTTADLKTETTTWSGNPARWDTGTPGKPVETTRTANVGTTFKPGDRVVHAKFGPGLVLRSMKQRDDEEVEVFFEGHGGKRLSAALSGLKKS
ncbi:MAG TPA: UvrD-helicase domain-containing protein [Thermoflexales bacterium]|nr:UvrD-helicase domain-containing protein [Thermoflexales bacterium]HQX08923.1 UvrD-helicase domain-containing protein [Thermoflexales bacterium]HQY24635.1 UvrD-helicase domain-containing protein [Thermoflexales bacterium]HQZ54068.1 UvrD-helicase domain-containing protein [Thermoflexales bacterium]